MNSKVKGNFENIDIEQKLTITSDTEGSGFYVKNGNILCHIKELMMVSNIFDALKNLTGVSKETKSIADTIMPYIRFNNISFTASKT